MKKLLLVALVCAWVGPVAQGQTGRIAHFSHGGSVTALAAREKVEDNFGIIPKPVPRTDSVRYISATAVVLYSHRITMSQPALYGQQSTKSKSVVTTDTLALPEPMTAANAVRYLRENRYLLRHDAMPVKYIGFDSINEPVKLEVPIQKPARKRKASRAGLLPTWPTGRGGAALLLLAALTCVSWFLAGKPRFLPAA